MKETNGHVYGKRALAMKISSYRDLPKKNSQRFLLSMIFSLFCLGQKTLSLRRCFALI